MPVLAGPEPWGLRPTDRQGAGWPDSPWLTRIQADLLDLSYVYPAAGSNNGRISAETNNLTNTQVSYTYDELNRLATAVSATGGTTNWGLSFSYDVYGNRTAQTVTAGSAPAFSATFGSNNRMVGYSYDNNGNQLTTPDGATLEYDPDNRMTKWTRSGQVEQYQYHPSGWRMQKAGPSWATYFYGPGGQLLSALDGSVGYTDYVYFGGRLLFTLGNGEHGYKAVTRVYTDRLGSTRATETVEWMWQTSTTRNYYPFGEEMTAPQGGDQYKFASTYRDSATGLDYAVNRYYASGTGRFLTPDYYTRSAGADSPQTFNRYNYAGNDPVNMTDPDGLFIKNVPPTPPDPGTREGEEIEGPRGEGQPPEGGGGFASGISNALNGLQTISLGAFKSNSKCKEFFGALIQEAGLDMTVDALMDQVASVASDALKNGYVYDGPSSNTALDADKFLDTASSGASTVGEWFEQSNTHQALSQFNGSAIWIRQSDWYGLGSQFVSGQTPNQYGTGALMHELLHKQAVGGGFTHAQMQNALDAIGAPPGTVGRATQADRPGKHASKRHWHVQTRTTSDEAPRILRSDDWARGHGWLRR